MQTNRKHFVVIGGGITGLSSAFYLHKLSEDSGCCVQVTLLEKSSRLGGSIQTQRKDGFIIEKGPDSFLARKPAIIRLSRELGLHHEWVGMNPSGTKSSIYADGRLHPMPDGLALGIPTRLRPFIRTPLLSVSGKARAALDFLLPRRQASGDESLGGLIERRLGSQVADRLVGPVLAGIYAGDLHTLSTAATFPQLMHLEQQHRSIILGMLASRAKQPAARPSTGGEELPSHLKKSMFLSYRQGLLTLVERLADILELYGSRIVTNCGAIRIARQEDGYRVTLEDGSELIADGVVMAVPAEQAGSMLGGQSDQLKQLLSVIPSVSVANVVMAFDERQLPRAMTGSGFVVPRNQGLFMTACTFASNKWSHTAPEGKLLLRAYIGHSADQSHVQMDDEQIIGAIKNDLRRVLGIAASAEPLFTEITRHPKAMPQYRPGHMDILLDLERELEAQLPGVVAAGGSYRGVGLPDCIAQGLAAAERMLQRTSIPARA